MNIRELRELLSQLDSRQRILVGTPDGQALGQPHLTLVDPGKGPYSPVMLYAYPPGYEPERGECDCLLCAERIGARVLA